MEKKEVPHQFTDIPRECTCRGNLLQDSNVHTYKRNSGITSSWLFFNSVKFHQNTHTHTHTSFKYIFCAICEISRVRLELIQIPARLLLRVVTLIGANSGRGIQIHHALYDFRIGHSVCVEHRSAHNAPPVLLMAVFVLDERLLKRYYREIPPHEHLVSCSSNERTGENHRRTANNRCASSLVFVPPSGNFSRDLLFSEMKQICVTKPRKQSPALNRRNRDSHPAILSMETQCTATATLTNESQIPLSAINYCWRIPLEVLQVMAALSWRRERKKPPAISR